jgi:hypothetical protein
MHCVVWYALHGPLLAAKHDKRVFSTVKTRIRYLVRQFREKGSSDKALRVSSLDYDVARVYMNILASTLNGSISGFSFFFFLSLPLAFTSWSALGPLVGPSLVTHWVHSWVHSSVVVEDVGRWLVTMSGSWYGTYTPLFKMRYCRHHIRDD